MKPEEVPDDLMNAGRNALAIYYRRLPPGVLPTLEERTRVVLAAALPAARKQWFAELFGTPEEIRLREQRPARRDMPEELTFRLVGKIAVLPEDLSAVLAAVPDGSVESAVVGRLADALEVAQVMGAGGRPDDDLRRRLSEGADHG